MAEALSGKLELRPADREGEPITLPAKMGIPVKTQLPCASKWEVTPVFPDSWGPRTTVVAGSPASEAQVRLKLWPLGRITGTVKLLEKKDKAPKLLTIATLPPRTPAQRDIPKGTLDCPLDPQGKWQCPPLPASTFDVVISAEGYIPQYRWNLKVSASKTTDLGSVELKRGASVAGWVEAEDGAIDVACTARLLPQISPGSGPQVAEKIGRTAADVRVRKDGFFQFVGVPPGSYKLEVRQPGFAAVAVEPVQVSAKQETFLREPVTLKRPLRLEVAVSPPLDWLGKPWKVLIFKDPEGKTSFEKETVFGGTSDPQGLVTVAEQSPGWFQVHVSDSSDNQLLWKAFRVIGPEDARQNLRIEILTVTGTVKLGKEPLAATLQFGGRYGSSSIRMESDNEGRFHGILPQDGWWRVDVSAARPRFDTRTRVKAEPAGKDQAKVAIVLPATRVYGQVLDDRGRPAAAADVSLTADDVDLDVKADDLGRFEVRGLKAGMALAMASLSTPQAVLTSDPMTLALGEDQETGPIEIRLRRARKLSGSVQSARGPVPGAAIDALALAPLIIGGDRTRTDLDGSFTLELPAPTLTVAVIVSPPGFALSAFPLNPADAAPRFVVGAEGGDLEILLPDPPEDAGKEEVSLWVFQNGLPLPPGVLQRWLLSHGGNPWSPGKNRSYPALAPGSYRACLAARTVLAQWQASGWTAPVAKCASGQLAAGSRLQLDLSEESTPGAR
jgi:hypothetical protein